MVRRKKEAGRCDDSRPAHSPSFWCARVGVEDGERCEGNTHDTHRRRPQRRRRRRRGVVVCRPTTTTRRTPRQKRRRREKRKG